MVGVYRSDAEGRLTALAAWSAGTPQMVQFSRDGRTLAVALASNKVEFHSLADPAHPTLLGTFDGLATAPIAIAVSPTEDVLAVGEDSGRVHLVDIADPAAPRLSRTFGDAHGTVYGLGFSPDGRLLAASTGEDVVWGWSLGATPRVEWTIESDVGRPWDVRFVAGGSRVLVAGDQGRVRWWDVGPDATASLCRVRGSALTPDEWARYVPGIDPQDPC